MSRSWSQLQGNRSARAQEDFSHFPPGNLDSKHAAAIRAENPLPSSLYLFTKDDFMRMGHKLDRLTEENQELKEKTLRLESELIRFQSQQFQQGLGRSGSALKSTTPNKGKVFHFPSPRKVVSTLGPSVISADPEMQNAEELEEIPNPPHAGLESLKTLSEQRLRDYIRVLESYILSLDVYARPHPPELHYLLEGRKVENKHIDMVGKEYVGQALAGKPSGRGKLSSPGHIIEGEFLNGKPHGKVVITRDEYREKCRFVYGLKQGYYEKAYRDGGFESGCLVDGLSQGPKKVVHPDGSLEYLSMHSGVVVGVSLKLSRDKTQIEIVDRTGAHLIKHLYKKKLQQ